MNEIPNPLTKDLYLDKLKRLKAATPSFTGTPPSAKYILLSMAEEVMFLEELIYHVDDIGASASNLIEMKDHVSHVLKIANATSQGFAYASLVIAAVDFIRIPAVYIASAALGREVPFKLTKAARWGYSSVMLGLTIAAIAVPVIAPILGVAIAAVVFSVNAFTLGRFFYKRAQKRKELEQLTKKDGDIETAEEELQDIQRQADELMEVINKKQHISNQEQIEINDLETKFHDKKTEIQKLYDRKEKLKVTLDKSTGRAINKGVAVALSAAILTGFALSLVFPPVGLAVLISASAAASVFVIGHIALPRLKKTRFGNWLASLFKRESSPANTPAPKSSEAEEKADDIMPLEPGSEEIHVQTNNIMPPQSKSEEIHETTVDIMRKLFKTEEKDALRKLVMDMQKMEALDSHFTHIVEKQDEKAAVLLFNKLAFKANKHKLTEDDAKGFYQQLNSFDEGVILLRKGLSKVQSGEYPLDIAENLFSNEILIKSLDLEQYRPKGDSVSEEPVKISPTEDDKDGDGDGKKEENKVDVNF